MQLFKHNRSELFGDEELVLNRAGNHRSVHDRFMVVLCTDFYWRFNVWLIWLYGGPIDQSLDYVMRTVELCL